MEVADSSAVAASLQDKPQGMLKVLARRQSSRKIWPGIDPEDLWGIQGIGGILQCGGCTLW